jgi:hypothetical protein
MAAAYPRPMDWTLARGDHTIATCPDRPPRTVDEVPRVPPRREPLRAVDRRLRCLQASATPGLVARHSRSPAPTRHPVRGAPDRSVRRAEHPDREKPVQPDLFVVPEAVSSTWKRPCAFRHADEIDSASSARQPPPGQRLRYQSSPKRAYGSGLDAAWRGPAAREKRFEVCWTSGGGAVARTPIPGGGGRKKRLFEAPTGNAW